tara:strand:- start:80 stop:223 length:144 start_codon:yes stop_codon:yes gene_type:complete
MAMRAITCGTLKLKLLVLQGVDPIPMLKILILEELLHRLGAVMFSDN